MTESRSLYSGVKALEEGLSEANKQIVKLRFSLNVLSVVLLLFMMLFNFFVILIVKGVI